MVTFYMLMYILYNSVSDISIYLSNLTKSNILGRDWLPICRRSLNPRVIKRAMCSPFLSKRALVATVVPIRIHSIMDESMSSSREMETLKY